MQQEAREASIFLGEEVDGVLADRVLEGEGFRQLVTLPTHVQGGNHLT